MRARYTSPEKRKELLDSVVRFEVLAREAESRGYARDPDVVRLHKQRAIDRMIAEGDRQKLRPESIPRTNSSGFTASIPRTTPSKRPSASTRS